MIRNVIFALIVTTSAMLLLMVGRSSIARKLVFYPTHGTDEKGLKPWIMNGVLIGYSRTVDSPKNVWLMLHGNGGQASHRTYAIPCFSTGDSVFILEYPGYGSRKGVPSKESFNQAAKEAYLFLREGYPDTPVCVVGESIGSGPASSLASLAQPPDKLVLVVPFDKLSLVAKDYVPSFLVALFLRDNWDNIEALSNYKRPVDIFGALDDTIIPFGHAKALAASVPSSKFVVIEGGHNDWSRKGRVQIGNEYNKRTAPRSNLTVGRE
jgi:pimeloyl-ACP methyl ester carboxylesterase